jgi:hypothetical protein
MTEVGTKVITISSEIASARRNTIFGSKKKNKDGYSDQNEEEQDDNSLDLATLVKGFKLEIDLKGFSFSIIDN